MLSTFRWQVYLPNCSWNRPCSSSPGTFVARTRTAKPRRWRREVTMVRHGSASTKAVTLQNYFHWTEVELRIDLDRIQEANGKTWAFLTENQYQKANRRLCGARDCGCGGVHASEIVFRLRKPHDKCLYRLYVRRRMRKIRLKDVPTRKIWFSCSASPSGQVIEADDCGSLILPAGWADLRGIVIGGRWTWYSVLGHQHELEASPWRVVAYPLPRVTTAETPKNRS